MISTFSRRLTLVQLAIEMMAEEALGLNTLPLISDRAWNCLRMTTQIDHEDREVKEALQAVRDFQEPHDMTPIEAMVLTERGNGQLQASDDQWRRPVQRL